MTDMMTTRRTMIAGVAALASLPAATAATASSVPTAIGRLWSEAEGLKARLGDLVDLAEGDSIPRWMRVSGEANILGNRRYETLVTLLTQDAATQGDLGIMARATAESEIVNGPRQWAHERLAAATRDFAAIA